MMPPAATTGCVRRSFMRRLSAIAGAMLALAVALETVPAQAAGAAYKVHVIGLACPFCAYGIEKSLSGIEGVRSVETHIAESIVIVEMKDGRTLDKAAAARAVKDAGFTLDGFEPVSEGGK